MICYLGHGVQKINPNILEYCTLGFTENWCFGLFEHAHSAAIGSTSESAPPKLSLAKLDDFLMARCANSDITNSPF